MSETRSVPMIVDILLYTTPAMSKRVEVYHADETFWLNQKNMASLFNVEIPTINYHLKDIYKSNELLEASTIRKFLIVQSEGSREVSREVAFYNLDVIIAVGYRINSYEATQFRIWATQTLREFVIKGFVMDDERLKQGTKFGKDYFDELLEKIREIRASERRFYQKITDIFALSSDYRNDALQTQEFFAKVQNKLHWAISGKTAAELIYSEADASKLHMGLKTWKNSPYGKILKSDVSIAKNYLDEKNLKSLERIVSAYLDLAEDRANRQILTTMREWDNFLDKFLTLSDYPILQGTGKISHEIAKFKAEGEYVKYRVIQDKEYESDFDRVLNELINGGKNGK